MNIEQPIDAIGKSIKGLDPAPFRYSLCTNMTRPAQYQEFLQSFIAHGFTLDDCEFLYVDNSRGNVVDGYDACNLFLQVAKGEYIVLVHQDVLAIDPRELLDKRLSELSAIDPLWGMCGNAGTSLAGLGTARYTDGNGEWNIGPFPNPVVGLDENFMIARRTANLAVSSTLKGFHLYGTELCMVASILGMRSYVIDFHVNHNAEGRPSTHSQPFLGSVASFVKDRSSHLRPRILGATSGLFLVSRWNWLARLVNRALRTRFQARIFRLVHWMARRLP